MPLTLSELYVANAPSEIGMRPFPKVVSEFDVKRFDCCSGLEQNTRYYYINMHSWFNSRVVTMVALFTVVVQATV